MAGVHIAFSSGVVAMGNGKTILQLVTAAHHRVVCKGFSASIAGTSATDAPVEIQVLRQTTAGTMSAGAAGTNISKKDSSDSETLQTTTQVNATVEPTGGDIIGRFYLHPQAGQKTYFPFNEEIHIPASATLGRLGFKTVTALTYNCLIEVDGEE